MSIACEEIGGRKSGFSIDEKGIWSFKATSQYQILSSTRLTGFESVSGLPQPGSSWPGVPRCRLYDVSASEDAEKCEDGTWRWVVSCNYTSRPFNATDNNKNEVATSPLDWPAVWSGWKSEQIQITPLRDLDNKPWLNPAGDRFSNVPTITTSGASVTVTKNYPSFSGAYALSLIGKCNADTFSGATKGQLMISDIVPTEKNNGEMTYYEVAITIKYSPIRWDEVEAINMGSHVLKKTNETSFGFDIVKVLPTDAEGNVSTEPVLMDAEGYQLASNNLEDATYTKFRVCDSISFNALGLI